jgi:ligand-binding sensor domain-containing protein
MVVALFSFLISMGALQAQLPHAQVQPQYKITSWTTDDGLPGNACVKLFQDLDGFLWIGNFDGLVRFDGTRFITYNKNNLLLSNYAITIKGDQQGNLWVGTDHGLALYKNGKMFNLSSPGYDFYIESLYVDELSKKIWIGTRNSGFYTYDIQSKKYELIEGLELKDIINDILKDKEGTIWAAGEKNGLIQYKKGKWNTYGEKDGLSNREIKSLLLDDRGVMYVATTSGLFTRQPGEQFVELPEFHGTRINKVAKDADGKLWVGTVNGLYKELASDQWLYLSRENGLSNNDIRDIYFDVDGSIWLGTYRGGINQLRETKFSSYYANEGLDVEAVGALCLLKDGSLLIGSTQGLIFSLKNNQIKKYPVKTPINQRIYSILQDDKKNLWVASYDGLLLITPDGKEKLFTEKNDLPTNQVRIIFQDKKNQYWIGTRNAGLLKMDFKGYAIKPRFDKYMYEELNEINSTFIMDINEDSKNNLLLCTNTGGITTLSADGHLTNYTKKSGGLESNTCFSVREDKQGIVWIATTDGLSRLKDGKIFTFARKDGMPHENPMDVIEDDLGYFWLPTQKGTIRVNRQQLNDYADGKLKSLAWKLFDKNNDLVKSECTGTAHSLKDANGRIWVPMIGGLMAVNPSDIHVSQKTPRVYIEKVTLDDYEKSIEKPIVVVAGSHRIAFEYIALTLVYPNSARYKYQLQNFDKAWVDAGTDRQAVYTNLPPGQYTFAVKGCNNDGVWSPSNASLSIVVEPHFYQAWWFYLLSFFTVIVSIVAYIRMRTGAIKHKAVYLEQQVKERTRFIAQQRDELVALNEELQSSQEEVMAQRDALREKIGELAEKNDEVEKINTNLEKLVEERTKVLEDQNKRLSEYAFINAHKLRAPLASILGLISLITRDAFSEAQLQIKSHLLTSADELDKIVRSINRMLEKESTENSKNADDDGLKPNK